MKRWRLALVTATLTAAAAIVTVVSAAAPAGADAGGCVPIYSADHTLVGQYCPPEQVRLQLPPGCPMCQIAVVSIIEEHELPVDVQQQFLGNTLNGFSALSAAQTTTDPIAAGQLRGEAQNDFAVAVGPLGGAPVRLGQVGFLDPTTLTFEPVPQPWLQNAGVDVVRGLTLTQGALVTGSGAMLDAAWASFIQAYELVAQNETAGG